MTSRGRDKRFNNTSRHGSIRITVVTDGPRMDDSQFLEELEPWYNSPEGKKQVDIFLNKQKLEQPELED